MRKFVSTLTLAVRWTTPASVIVAIVSFLGSSASTGASPTTKETDVNGVRLTYVEQGSGEPVVFVHGAVGDLRAWESLREEIAQKQRFIAYTQRYLGTNPWPDDGKGFSVATHADDLATFIAALNAGPVHIVGWSYGGTVAINAAIKDPSLVRSLVPSP